MMNKTLLVLALGLSFAAAYAQTDSEERVLNSDPIDVDGYLAEDKPVTDRELQEIQNEIRKQKNEVQLNKQKSKGFKELSKTTEKLSETTEEYLDEKKSAQKDIAEYNKKIKCLMEQTPGPECDKYNRNRRDEAPEVAPAPVAPVVQEVQVAQAAPAPVVEATVPAASNDMGAAFETIKLLPYAGGTQYNGKVEQVESEVAAGVRLESNVTPRISVGIGFNFSQFNTDDFANNLGYMADPNYLNNYGQSREMQYRQMGVDIYAKFFISQGARFRPYLGAGLGYNRATMKYTQNDQFNSNYGNYGYVSYGNEEFNTSFATGQLMLGTEIMVTNSIGINLEAAYATGLGNALSSKSNQNPYNSPDQSRLQDLGNEIINANMMSIFGGMVVKF